MSPVFLLIIFILLWSFLHFWIIPFFDKKWKSNDMRVKLLIAGVKAVAESVSKLSFSGAIALSFVIAFIALCDRLGSRAVIWPREAINAMASFYSVLKTISNGYGNVICLLGLIGAACTLYFISRTAKQRVINAWRNKAHEEFDALINNPSQLDDLRNDSELASVVENIKNLLIKIDSLEGLFVKDKKEIARLQGIVKLALSDLAIEVSRKKMDITAALDENYVDEEKQPHSKLSRFLRVLMSRKLQKDFRLVNKPLKLIVVGLSIVSLIGWTSVPLANSMRLAVNNLNVQIMEKDASNSLEQALSNNNTIEDDTQSIEPVSVITATEVVSRAFFYEAINEALNQKTVGNFHGELKSQPQVEFVRAAIANKHIDTAKINEAVLLRQEAYSIITNNDAVDESKTKKFIEANITPVIKKMYETNPKLLASLVHKLERRYADVMPVLDAQSIMTSNIIDTVLGEVKLDANTELGKQANSLMKNFSHETINTWVNASLKKYLADILMGITQPEMKSLLSMELSPDVSRLFNALRTERGNGWIPNSKTVREGEMNNKIAESYFYSNENNPNGLNPKSTNNFSGYDNIFPRSNGMSENHKVDSSLRFGSAIRSFRVRGVIFGRELEGLSPEVINIKWREDPNENRRMIISLLTVDSKYSVQKWVDIGSFERGVINQGLQFAADQRVVAVTMIPVRDDKINMTINLHPSLIDTPLGCRIIALDTIVDTFTKFNPNQANDNVFDELISDRSNMLNWMVAMNLGLEISAEEKKKYSINDVDQLMSNNKWGNITFSAETKKLLGNFIEQELKYPAWSNDFLKKMDGCIFNQKEKFSQCLYSNVLGGNFLNDYWFPVDHTSQVRERRITADPNFNWLRVSADHLSHLDFSIFTNFSRIQSHSDFIDENENKIFEFPPSQLQALRKNIIKNIRIFLLEHYRESKYAEFMRPVEEFVIIQSLARAALDGRLGSNFPLNRLIQLERDTRSYVPSQPTIRWRTDYPEQLEAFLQGIDGNAAERFVAYRDDQKSRSNERRPVCGEASN
jgi:hypothetical protein